MAGYETNLASELYILSALHRIGLDASLTLGNKKSVDILVARPAGDVVTVDVKGVAGKHDWPADNIKRPQNPAPHFLVFVSFEGRFTQPNYPPSVWVVPFEEVEQFRKGYSGRSNISRALLVREGAQYKDAWELLRGPVEPTVIEISADE